MKSKSRSRKVLTPEQQVRVSYAERSPSGATTTFDDRYAERSSARKVRSQSKAKARDQQVGTKPTEEPLDPDKAENDKAVRELAIARAQSRKKVERRVLQDGWQWHGGFYGGETPGDGYTQPALPAAYARSSCRSVQIRAVCRTRLAGKTLSVPYGIRRSWSRSPTD